MPQQISVIKAFVASPSDVQQERDALQPIVNEVNQNIGSSIGIRLELLKWETDVTPGFGNDAQDVINQQIGDDYDIFIGILWARAGTPTPRAGSGTLEEFERAYQKYKENSDSVDLLIYFKEAPLSPSKIDGSQLEKIKEFKSSLGEKGGLYWTFDGLQNFEATLRGHLSNLARKWKDRIENKSESLERIDQESKSSVEEIEQTVISEVIEKIEDEDDYGFFDYIDIYTSKFDEMNTAIEGLAKANTTIGEKMSKRTKSLNLAKEINDQKKVYSQVKKILKLTSNDLDDFSLTLNKQIEILSNSKNIAFDALGKSLTLYLEAYPDETDQLEMLESQLKEFLNAMKSPYQSIDDFRNTISDLPKFTNQFNKSKRLAANSLDKLLEEFDDIENTASNLLDSTIKLKERENSKDE